MTPNILCWRRTIDPIRRWAAGALLAGLAACSSSQSVARSAASTVRVEGVRALAADEVDALFRRADDPEERQRGALLLQAELYNRGHLGVRVSERVARDGATVLVVDEGPRFQSGQVSVVAQCASREKVDLASLQASLRAAAGRTFSTTTLDDAKRSFLEPLREAGHAHASVESHVEIRDNSHVADVTLSVVVGPVVIVERLDLTSDLVPFRDRMALREGQPLKPSVVEATKRSLRAALPGRSIEISVELSPTRADRAVVIARAAAAAPPSLPTFPPPPLPPTKDDFDVCERAFRGVVAAP